MKNIDITLPQSWDDLNQNQLKQLAKLLFYKVERASFDLGVLLILLEIKWWQFKKFKQARMLVLNHRFEDIKKHYSFIYNQTNLKKFIPSITIGKTTYHGPAPFLLNVTAYEFSVADDMYLRFNKAKNHAQKLEFAQYLAGILYLRQNSIPFNVTNLESMREPFKKADDGFLFACMLSYSGCRFQLEKRYKRVFSGSPKGTTATKSKNYGFGKILLQMAGGKFGSHEETKRTPLHTFLEQLNEDLTPVKIKK